jgi:AP-2 complex subunit mu-1
MAENFRTQILNSKESSGINTPVRTLGGCTYLYLRHNDIYILGVTKNNVNVMLAFKFMTSVGGRWLAGARRPAGPRARPGR